MRDDDDVRYLIQTGIIVAGVVAVTGMITTAITLFNYWGLR